MTFEFDSPRVGVGPFLSIFHILWTGIVKAKNVVLANFCGQLAMNCSQEIGGHSLLEYGIVTRDR